MKKFLLILVLIFFINPISFAYNLTSNDKIIIKKFIEILEKQEKNSRVLLLNKLKTIKQKKKNNNRISKILEEIIGNFEEKIKNNSSKTSPIKEKENKNFGKKLKEKQTKDIINYDIEKIRNTWISWHNIERKKLGLKEYKENNKLNISATNWSIENRNKKKIDHKRSPGDSYYDYKKITKWMKENGVVCKNIYRATYSESIGRAWITCNKDDCTDEIIKGIKGTFDYFMGEKGISGIAGAHYRAIVHPRFTQIGFGIAVEKIGKNSYRIYHTTHYCTKNQ